MKALEDGRRTGEAGSTCKEPRTGLHEFKELNEGQWYTSKTSLELSHLLWQSDKMEARAFYPWAQLSETVHMKLFRTWKVLELSRYFTDASWLWLCGRYQIPDFLLAFSFLFLLFVLFSTETLYLTALGPKSLHPWREKREEQCGASVSLDIAS